MWLDRRLVFRFTFYLWMLTLFGMCEGTTLDAKFFWLLYPALKIERAYPWLDLAL